MNTNMNNICDARCGVVLCGVTCCIAPILLVPQPLLLPCAAQLSTPHNPTHHTHNKVTLIQVSIPIITNLDISINVNIHICIHIYIRININGDANVMITII